MRLCRFFSDGPILPGFYFDDRVVPLPQAFEAWARDRNANTAFEIRGDDLLWYLPPEGPRRREALEIARWLETDGAARERLGLPRGEVRLLAPVPAPRKILLLAGNYAEHVREGGGLAVERAKTFPYVFMKPPSTTLNHPDRDIALPAVSPDHIDYEVELGVVIGRRARRVAEKDALSYVAGYTVVNDLSDRRFRPNPQRVERERDKFHDWLHGKWHDGFCPVGPCIRSADGVDPQGLRLRLRVNGEVRQDATTAQQIFPVAAVIAFISSFVTLEPGDIISTGTPSGVGAARGVFLRPGDRVEAEVEGIGVLVNRMVREE